MNILVKWPTRGKPKELEARWLRWHDTESNRNQVRYLMTVDHDDSEGCSCAALITNKYESVFCDFIEPRGKIHACNAGLSDTVCGGFQWDVVVLASDDFAPLMHGWDESIRLAMEWHFPAKDGLIHFPDAFHAGAGYTTREDRERNRPPPGRGRKALVTIPVMGINMFRRYGHIYNSSYKSEFCDNEQTESATKLSKIRYVDLPVFEHNWRGKLPNAAASDPTFAANMSHHMADQRVYTDRAAKGFDLKKPRLSILVCALWERREVSRLLFDEIYRQIWALPDPWQVELHVSMDGGHLSVGEKRNRLIEAAHGDYMTFIDDDDWIAHDYVPSLANKCDGSTDCVVFGFKYLCDGKPGRAVDLDIRHTRDYDTPTLYCRMPRHINPVRTDIAKKVGFLSRNCGEDSQYAAALRGHLRTQAVVVDEQGQRKDLYFYRYSNTGTRTQYGGRNP